MPKPPYSDDKDERIWEAVMKVAGDEYDIEIKELMRAVAGGQLPPEILSQAIERYETQENMNMSKDWCQKSHEQGESSETSKDKKKVKRNKEKAGVDVGEILSQAIEKYETQENMNMSKYRCQKSHENGEGSGTSKDKKKVKRNKERVGVVDVGESKTLPGEMMNKVRSIEGYDHNDPIMFVIEKKLSNSDVGSGQNRFSIPPCQSNLGFLKEEDLRRLERYRESRDTEYDDLKVLLVEPSLHVSNVSFRRWRVGSGTSYMLTHGWSSVVERNSLREGDVVQLWAFRVFRRFEQLCFALVML